MTVDPETARWLDGPELAQWLDERNWREYRGTVGRYIRAWRSGRKASLASADRVLTHFGGNLFDVPGEIWRSAPRNPGAAGHDPVLKEMAVAGVRAGATHATVASVLKVGRGTVSKWVRDAA